MKKRLLRIIALAVAAVCLFSQYAVASVSPNIIRVNSNTEFAVEAAKIAAEYERQTDFSAEDCRIIGKVLSSSFDFGKYGAAKGVIGADGRFILQFKSEEAASNCLAMLNADAKAAYAEQGINASGFSTSSVGEKTVTVEYGGCTASFKITVEYAWWQRIIRILLLGFLWY